MPELTVPLKEARGCTLGQVFTHSSYAHSTAHIITPSQCSFLPFPHLLLHLLPLVLLVALVTPPYDLMGNFASSSFSASSSRPTTTSSPLPPPPLSHRTTLTSTLTAYTTRFAHLFRIADGRIRLDDVEEGDTSARGPHPDTDVLDGRRRALLIGIAYNGELPNTHKDIDRYRDVLLGTPSLFCVLAFFFPHWCFLIVLLLLCFVLLTHERRYVWVPR